MKRLIFSLAAIAITSIAVSAKTEVIAHRGHWTADGAAQNSIIALQRLMRLDATALNLTYGFAPTIKSLSTMTISLTGKY